MEKRLGCVSVILDRQAAPIASINELLSQFGDCILARLGLPYPSHGVNIITLVTESSTDRLTRLRASWGNSQASRSSLSCPSFLTLELSPMLLRPNSDGLTDFIPAGA